MPATISGLRPTRSDQWPVPIWPAPHTAGYSPATRPICAALAPCAARKSGTRPQASASLRLLTRPAYEHVARGELAGQPAAQRGGDGDAAVPGGLVEAERQAAPARSYKVDLHHHGHGPGETLVDAEQDV